MKRIFTTFLVFSLCWTLVHSRAMAGLGILSGGSFVPVNTPKGSAYGTCTCVHWSLESSIASSWSWYEYWFLSQGLCSQSGEYCLKKCKKEHPLAEGNEWLLVMGPVAPRIGGPAGSVLWKQPAYQAQLLCLQDATQQAATKERSDGTRGYDMNLPLTFSSVMHGVRVVATAAFLALIAYVIKNPGAARSALTAVVPSLNLGKPETIRCDIGPPMRFDQLCPDEHGIWCEDRKASARYQQAYGALSSPNLIFGTVDLTGVLIRYVEGAELLRARLSGNGTPEIDPDWMARADLLGRVQRCDGAFNDNPRLMALMACLVGDDQGTCREFGEKNGPMFSGVAYGHLSKRMEEASGQRLPILPFPDPDGGA